MGISLYHIIKECTPGFLYTTDFQKAYKTFKELGYTGFAETLYEDLWLSDDKSVMIDEDTWIELIITT